MDSTEIAVTEEKLEERTEERETGAEQEEFSQKQEGYRETAGRLERNGELKMQNLKFGDALEDFRRSQQLFKKANDQSGVARLLYRQGYCYEQVQKYNEAEKYYMEARVIYKKLNDKEWYGTCSDRLARVYYWQKNLERSAKIYKSAIEMECEMGELYNNLAFIQIEMGEFQDSLQNLEKAKELREKEGTGETRITYNNLGVVEYILGNYEKAETYFKTGIDMPQQENEEIRSIQYVVFLKPEYKGEKFTTHRVFHDVHTRACLMLNLSASLGMKGDMENALQYLNHALAIDENRPYLYEFAGWFYINKAEESKALEFFRKARSFAPDNTELKKIAEMINPYAYIKVQRNDPCPCGSGKKFKKCHGANI